METKLTFAAAVNWEWVHAHHTAENGPFDITKDEAFLVRIREHAVRNGYRGRITRIGLARIANRNLY